MRLLRLVPHLILALFLALAGYLVVGGWFVARETASLLRVGTLTNAAAGKPVPTDPMTPGYRGDPQVALGLQFQPMMVETDLGPAPAWFIPPAAGQAQTDAGIAAIYVHGIAGAREDGYRHALALHAAGIPTLIITYRNDEGAPADPSGSYSFGIREWRDLDDAVTLLVARGYERLILVGESMGGAIVGQFLAQSEQTEHIAGIIIDAPALDFHAILTYAAARRGLPLPGILSRVGLWFLSWQGTDLRGADVTGTMAAYPGPIFLAHGVGDPVVPVSGSFAMLDQRRGFTAFVVTGAGHLGSWAEAQPVYPRALAHWLTIFAGD